MTEEPRATLALWEWRRRVADLYAEVRRLDPQDGWQAWRRGRDALFRDHPQSPLRPDRRRAFAGLGYFPYDPALRATAAVETADPDIVRFAHSGDGTTPARVFGVARFRLRDVEERLTLFWLEQYGGGVFLPFRDATNGETTYGGGRYLLDTAKGADLGWVGDRVLLDFNFSYHPSCAHDSQWSCPLSPPGNTLAVAVTTGERLRS